MKKIALILLLLVVLLGIGADKSTNSGCSSGGKAKTPSKVDPYIGGTRGLTIQFEDGYPPSEVYDNGQFPFDIDVKLENVGEYDIDKENVVVKISGINPDDFGVTENFLIKEGVGENLPATRKDAEGNIIESNPVHVIFKDLNFKKKLEGNFNPPLRADVCYLYGTNAISDVCVVENVLVNDKDAVCQVSEDKVVFNSGGPVQVTDFKEMARGQGKVGFSFTLKHKGNGKIFSPWTKCTNDISHKNRVGVIVKTNLPGLTCTGLSEQEGATEGVAILYNGERTITCTQEVSGKLAYENRVEIGVRYDYLEDVSTTLLVKYSQ
jgi:hypothetical protein